MDGRKLKVMHIISSMSDGGAQKIVLNYLRDFEDDNEIELKLFVANSQSDSNYDKLICKEKLNVEYLNIQPVKVRIPLIDKFIKTRKVKKIWKKAIKEYNPDIVHVHISEFLLSTLDSIVKNNVPIRFDTLHSNPLRFKGKKLRVIRRAFQQENFIPICVTEEQAKVAKKYYGFKRFEVVHNGIDIKEIKEKMISKEEARKKYGISNEAYVVIGVGRLNKIKNFELLIDIFKMIAEKNEKAILILAGRGPELENLQKRIIKLNLKDKVRMIGNQENIIPLYCAADVMGVTSISESASLVLLEAQICKLRCVISNGVPRESIITDAVQQMNQNATIKDWADALQNRNFIGHAICRAEDYEKHELSKKMKNIYMKYWEEYKKDEK